MKNEVINELRKATHIVIYPHKNVDGDCLGSAFGLKLLLEGMGKSAFVDLEPGENEPFAVLYGAKDNRSLDQYDLAVAVDCANLDRLGTRLDAFEKARRRASIDHHVTNHGYADVDYIDPKASATGEAIYDIAVTMGVDITPEIASNLYLAICSDTACFRQANTTVRTMETVSKLMEYGVDTQKIHRALFYRPQTEVELLRETLQSLEFFADGRVSYIQLTAEQMRKCGATVNDCHGLINLARDVVGVEVAIFLREDENGYTKVGMRSVDMDVSKLCADRYGGGGHRLAAGCELEMPIHEAKKLIVGAIIDEL